MRAHAVAAPPMATDVYATAQERFALRIAHWYSPEAH
jgi:hypothetical protein